MRSAVTALAMFCALSACNRAHRADRDLQPAPVDEQAAALAAIEKMRVAFNAGNCKSIYDDAAAWFRANEREPDWDRECSEMRTKLGLWQRVDVKWNSFEKGRGAVYAESTGQFDAGSRALYMGWARGSDGNARLFQFSIQQQGAWASFPSNPGSMDRYRDAPMDIPVRPIAMPQFPQR
jgi:hypothetical protein